MKNVKLALFSLLGLAGVASAFTNGPKHFTGTTYFAVTDGSATANGFVWQTSHGQLLHCTAFATSKAVCTIVTDGTGYVPTAGSAPNLSHSTVQNSDSQDFYR